MNSLFHLLKILWNNTRIEIIIIFLLLFLCFVMLLWWMCSTTICYFFVAVSIIYFTGLIFVIKMEENKKQKRNFLDSSTFVCCSILCFDFVYCFNAKKKKWKKHVIMFVLWYIYWKKVLFFFSYWFVNLSKKRVIYRNQSVNYVRSVCDIAKTLNHYY